jgi:ribosomal protein S18 acetylase RimI-like enzyme
MELHVIDQYLFCAEKTAVFSAAEIKGLRDVLSDHTGHYRICAKKKGSVLQGFAVFGQTPFTASSWDLYWLVVAPESQRQGVGRSLIETVEAEMMQVTPQEPIVRIETSSRGNYRGAHSLYCACGYTKVGEIPDFYAPGDALLIFSKRLVTVSGGG